MQVRVRFEPSGREIRVRPGTALLAAARQAGLPVGSSCDGDGICAACGLRILEGAPNLTRERPLETKAKADNGIDAALRLSCLARVTGDVVVTADYW